MGRISIKAEVSAGADLFIAISEAIELAKKLEVTVVINFNGYLLHLNHWDDAEDKCSEYRRWEAAGGRLQEKTRVVYP